MKGFNPHAQNQLYITSLDEKGNQHTYDVSTLVDSIQFSTVLEGQAGKLTFQMQKDPNNILKVTNGSIVQFYRDKVGQFYGYVFNMGMDANGIFQITAYDQMRYLKNEDTVFYSGMTVSEVFNDLCTKHQLKNREVISPCEFICPNKKYEGQTLFNILKHQIQQANIASKGEKYYFIKDKFGKLQFTSIDKNIADIVIGYKSLLSSFQYEISIDKNTYNSIKVIKNYNSEDTKGTKSDNKIIVPYVANDSNNENKTQNKWGMLQKVITIDENMNQAQIVQYANDNRAMLNKETKSFKLSALGVDGIDAGTAFSVNIPELNTFKMDAEGKKTDEYLQMWALGATHTYTRDMHTMELDVIANAF